MKETERCCRCKHFVIVIITTLIILCGLLGVTYYMKGRIEKTNVPITQPSEVQKMKTPATQPSLCSPSVGRRVPMELLQHVVVRNPAAHWPGDVCSSTIDILGNLWRNKRILILGDSTGGRAVYISLVHLLGRNPTFVFPPRFGCRIEKTNNCADAQHHTGILIPEFNITLTYVWVRWMGTGDFKRGDDVDSSGKFGGKTEFSIIYPRQKFRWMLSTLFQKDGFRNNEKNPDTITITKLHREHILCEETKSCIPDVVLFSFGVHSLKSLTLDNSQEWGKIFESELVEVAALCRRWLPNAQVWYHPGLPVASDRFPNIPEPAPIMGWFMTSKLWELTSHVSAVLAAEAASGEGTINTAVLSKESTRWVMSLRYRFNYDGYHWLSKRSNRWESSMFSLYDTYVCSLMDSIIAGSGGRYAEPCSEAGSVKE